MSGQDRAVLMFDYDGVIADSLEYFMGAFLDACARHGFRQIQDRRGFMALFDTNMYDGMAAAGIGRERHDPVLITMSELLRDRAHLYRIFAAMPPVLERLARAHDLYIVTSNVGQVVREHLSANGVRCVLDVLGSEAGRSKAEKIRGLAKRHPGARCFYIGDTVGDMREAREAGATTIAVTWGWHERERLATACPDHMVDTPAALVALLSPAGG